jgi:hypothetical protein
MDRKATAVWQGDLHDGKGLLTTESTVLRAEISLSARLET